MSISSFLNSLLSKNLVLGSFADDPNLAGADLDDIVIGLAGNDELWGGRGDDILLGGWGNDRLRGEDGDDILLGNFGNDILFGGAGSDLLIGGLAYDTARFDFSVTEATFMTALDGSLVVTRSNGGIGEPDVDTLQEMEKLIFEDYTAFLTGENNAVVALDDAVTAAENTPLVIDPANLVANDFDFDNDTLTITSVALDGQVPGDVSVQLLNGDIVFDAGTAFDALAPGEDAIASFTYTVEDGNGSSDTATVTVTIEGANDAPAVTGPAAVDFAENGTGVVATFAASDPEGDSVRFSLAGDDAGLFDIDADGNLIFLAAPDFENPQDAGGDNVHDVTVVATDSGGASGTAEIDVTVTDVTQTPAITEIAPNPAGSDPANQTVEIRGEPGERFTGFLYSLESDSGSSTNTVDRLTAIDGTFRADGVATAAIPDLENPSFTLVLTADDATAQLGEVIDPANPTTLGTILDAVGVPDNGSDPVVGAQLGGIDLAHIGSEPELIFRDGTTGAWFQINFNGSIFDAEGDEIDASFFDAAPTATGTFGAVNPSIRPVINEIDADMAGDETTEFVELFDGGVGDMPLDGYAVVLFNGSDDASYAAFDLDGYSTDADGYFVIGGAGLAEADLVVTSSYWLQNGADAVALLRGDAADYPNDTPLPASGPIAGLVDALVYDTNDSDDAALLAGLGETVQVNEDENGLKDTQSISRLPNGTGDFVAKTPTPGAANDTVIQPAVALISEVQGTGDISPLNGQTVTVQAIVTGDFQHGDADALRDLDGFFLQEETSDHDDDAATSEGIFVYEGFENLITDVAVGDRVTVTGTVSEFFGKTQITATEVTVDAAQVVDNINGLAQSITLDSIDDVVAGGSAYLPYGPNLEAYESMLVTFTDTMTVAEMYNFDRFNEVVLSATGRPKQFTQTNDPDVAGYDAHLRAVGSDQVVFDDGLSVQNAPAFPEADIDGNDVFNTADGFGYGDTIDGLTGVLDYGFDYYRVRSVENGVNVFNDTETRETVPELAGFAAAAMELMAEDPFPAPAPDVTVASFNVLNFFTTIDDGQNTSGPAGLEPRGADSAEEYARQLEKLVTTLSAMDADILGLVELENEFGGDQNGDGVFAIDSLVAELNATMGAGTYAHVDPGRSFVDTGDAISVGIIYKPAVVTLVPGSVSILDDEAVATLPGYNAGAYGPIDPVDGFDPLFDGPSTNRAPLSANFEYSWTDDAQQLQTETFTIAVTHMKSKGGAGTGGDADALDGAGAYNETRTEGMKALTDWLSTSRDGAFAAEKQLVLGDFNAYREEDPIDEMTADGYTDLAGLFEPEADSFTFSTQTGTLDYVFADADLLENVTGAATWHINADEPDIYDYNLDFGRDPEIFDGSVPYRSSDHDPLLVGLDFSDQPLILV